MKIQLKLALFFLIGLNTISCDSDDSVKKNDTITQYEGWTLVWNDEFNDELIDTENWTYELGDGTDYGLQAGWGNKEEQIYTNNSENASIITDGEESVLAITALEGEEDSYTSAKLTTQNLFSFRYGRVEIKAKLPKGQGIWPAFWTLGANKTEIDWPGCGEIDIIEVLGHEPAKMYSTLHYTNSENKHGELQNEYMLPEGDFNDDYKVFGMDWTPESIMFNLNGEKIAEFDITDDMKEFQREAYLILNIAVGGNWPGNPDETTVFPQTMLVDYIRIYSQDGLNPPEAPALDMVEESLGQYIDPKIASYAFKGENDDLGNKKITTYGPGEPVISSSDVAIDGDYSMVFNFPGGNWGGAYVELENSIDISDFSTINISLNKPEALVNAEIKLESQTTGTSAVVFLNDYNATEASNGFVEYSIALSDFVGLELTELTIPFAMWNPQDESGEFVAAEVLIDNINFE